MATSEDLLAIGKQCSHQSCHLVDFLPFKCQHCQESYCQEHFMVQTHSCPKYDESKHNRVAPNCPFCNEPVAIPPGQDPNLRMETHIETQCSVMTGRAAKKTVPICARGRCGKALYAPIRCTACRSQFCPTHRFPKDHDCSAMPPTTNKSAAASAQAHGSKPITAGSHLLQLNNKAASAGAAIKKSINSATAAATANSSATNPSSSSVSNPFSKTDSSSSSRPVTIPKPVERPFSSFAPPPVFSTA